MTTTEQINELASALVKFQGECPVITFDSKVKVQTKTGRDYSFEYASLKIIKETCKPILLKNQLAVSQLVGQKQLTTMLIHSSGQYIADAMDLPLEDKPISTKDGIIKVPLTPQEIGSIITYMKRYSFSAILGLVSDEDDDANIAEGNKVSKPKEDKKPEKQPDKKLLPLKQNDANWQKCVVYLSQPGTEVNNLRVKYEISQETENQLMREVGELTLKNSMG